MPSVHGVPDGPPHKCHITGNSAPDAGPYIKLDKMVYDYRHQEMNPEGKDTWANIWISRVALMDLMRMPGMKLKTQERIRDLEAKVAELKKVKEIRVEVPVVEMEAVIDALRDELKRFAEYLLPDPADAYEEEQ